MTQIINISSSTNWMNELNKALAEFEQDYGVKPHMYCSIDFKEHCLDLLPNTVWIRDENTKRASHSGEYCGYSFELDDSVEPGVVILKG